ncbi:MAG TPA: carboxypeptidase regulatory-like domain-containing protein [Kofleriaceae bacterium]|jgi:plastocyanin|nr:carboxypeptidase regulatory-like domain-containing protein [Kofleriaceae bacterium]
MRCFRWIAYSVVAITFAPDARSDPRATPKVTHADIDRLDQKLEDQQHLIDTLIRLQTQYLQQLLALAPDSTTPPRTAAVDPPRPAENHVAAKTESRVDSKPEDRRGVPAKPRPNPKAVGTIVGKVTGGGGEAFVYVEDVVTSSQGTAAMKQENKQFVPQVLTVPRGTRVEFPNADPVFHNVFSVTPDASFDLGSYQQGASKNVTMTRSGVVTVYCNMHPQMVGYILVTPSKLYVRAGRDGFYRLANVPAGHHRVVAWAPNARPMTMEVDINEGDSATLEFELKQGRPRPHTNKDGMAYGSYKD